MEEGTVRLEATLCALRRLEHCLDLVGAQLPRAVLIELLEDPPEALRRGGS